MSPEKQRFPEWARQDDLAWIGHNLHVFWSVAIDAHKEVGLGAIVVDTTSQPIPGGGYGFWYFTGPELEEHDDEDIKRMVRGYDPTQEIVVVMLNNDNRNSTYRMRRQLGRGQGDPAR